MREGRERGTGTEMGRDRERRKRGREVSREGGKEGDCIFCIAISLSLICQYKSDSLRRPRDKTPAIMNMRGMCQDTKESFSAFRVYSGGSTVQRDTVRDLVYGWCELPVCLA